MAFPGGRQHAADSDLLVTAARETREEVGIDLAAASDQLGGLDDLPAFGGGRQLNLVITPFVYALTAPVTPAPDPREVQGALWVPIATLQRPESLAVHWHEIGAARSKHEAFIYRGHTIWGLTYRILRQFLEVLD
jgi:8-oxo-dGTP pyrophosphatase MutT (NUDIX family)